jgi:alkaline phosphatase D
MRWQISTGVLLFLACSFQQRAQPVERIAILGCHKQLEPAPALVSYVESEPDLCLWIGDNIYSDTTEDVSLLTRNYEVLAAKPAFQQLRSIGLHMATWDDHDFGLNNAGKEYPLKESSRRIFRNFWELENEIPMEREGVYYAKRYTHEGHTLQVIMLDPRYHRDPPDTDGDTLGEDQWKWLEEQLKLKADLRLVVSGFQILLDGDSKSETWGKFPQAKERLFETIRRTGAEGVVFLTGDQHYGEVARLPRALRYDAIELQFSGINQIEDPEFNTWRVSPVATSVHSLALIDIQWEDDSHSPAHLMFQVWNALSKQLELAYRVNLHELKPTMSIQGDQHFHQQQKVQIQYDDTHLHVRYTLDGSEPNASSRLYDGPLYIQKSCTFKAAFFEEDETRWTTVFERQFQQLTSLPSLQAKALMPGLRAVYLEGHFEKLPDYAAYPPEWSGIVSSPSLEAVPTREDHFAIQFSGLLNAPVDGVYDFRLISDDGSRLWIGNQLVADNDGSHSVKTVHGKVALKAGWHAFNLQYFEDYEGQSLAFLWAPPGNRMVPIPESHFSHQP